MEEQLCNEIIRFVADHPGNRLPGSDTPYLDKPLLGFASARDSLFSDYKKIIGPFHMLPTELLREAATVIAWILPISRIVRESNRTRTDLPSREWCLTRTNGETVNSDLRRHLVAWLEERGQSAVAPQLSPLWREVPDSANRVASTWSERHAAYAAGLGTFSLNEGFITEAGIAHRCGSIITSLSLSPSARRYRDHYANCLHYHNGSCGACIARCPVGAVTRAGHDKSRCREMVYVTAPAALSELYGTPQTGCGLCQTKVPCEASIPPACRVPE